MCRRGSRSGISATSMCRPGSRATLDGASLCPDAGRLHRIGIGRTHARTHVLLLVQDLDIRIVHAATGELLRALTLDPRATPSPPDAAPDPHPNPARPQAPRTLTWVRGVLDVSRHHTAKGPVGPVVGPVVVR